MTTTNHTFLPLQVSNKSHLPPELLRIPNSIYENWIGFDWLDLPIRVPVHRKMNVMVQAGVFWVRAQNLEVV